ncbi:alpha/beta-hydrolase [Apiospora marii]|uniref:Alpha/beta-hydrolase n=1 Tax=Apiospora marii TaxID=335849 RepID=A0ABR1RKC6_9PEZI
MDVAPEVPGLRSMNLSTKPDCPIKYTITTLNSSDEPQSNTILIVFINGLGLPQASWQPTLRLLQADLAAASSSAGTRYPGIHAVTYDRYGQGLSQPPHGAKPAPHDLLDAVSDLSAFLDGVKSFHLPENNSTRLFLVAHSIGVPLSRLYAERHPGSVAALLVLDSNMANNDFVSLFPDPDTPSFDPQRDLPPDTTPDQLRAARRFAQAMFHPSAPNGENLDRSTLPALLPLSDGPILIGDSSNEEGKPPLLLQVVGHDPETFAEESLKVSPRGLTERYVQPAWERYNEGLLAIGGAAAGSRKVVIAPGCGHFIQKNNPRFVADEVIAMVKVLCDGRA